MQTKGSMLFEILIPLIRIFFNTGLKLVKLSESDYDNNISTVYSI